jgi:hypothetical protein
VSNPSPAPNMQPDPSFVRELRTLFKGGTTPSALVRRIAERHPGEPQIDRLVRAYFREAFFVPMLQIGREQVEGIAQGGEAAALNSRYVHRMVAARGEWDSSAPEGDTPPACWLDSVSATDEAELLKNVESGTLPELADSWDRIDEQGKRFIARTVASAQALYETVQLLAALAEQLQQQLLVPEGVAVRGR